MNTNPNVIKGWLRSLIVTNGACLRKMCNEAARNLSQKAMGDNASWVEPEFVSADEYDDRMPQPAGASLIKRWSFVPIALRLSGDHSPERRTVFWLPLSGKTI